MVFTIELANEDGTDLSNFPKNPLEEKWNKLYLPISEPEYSKTCDGYSCMYCGRCHKGSYWKVPEEDKKVWDHYQEQIKEYNRTHNPCLYKIMT